MKRRNLVLLSACILAAGFSLWQRDREQAEVRRPGPLAGPEPGTLLPNGWQVTPAGRSIPLPGDLPLRMAFSPDGRWLLVSTGGFHDQGISVIDTRDGTLAQTVDLRRDWAGLCLDPDGRTVWVSGGGALRQGPGQKPVLRLDLDNGRLTPEPGRDVPGLAPADRWVAGLAAGPEGTLFVVNTQNDRVYRLGSATAVSARVGYRPYGIALSPDGAQAAVSNWGGASMSLLASGTLRETARVPVGSHPNDLCWAPDGRLFVANAGSNSVSVVSGGRVTETIKTSLSPTDPIGSTPDALALASDGRRLYVANADNNDVAVVDTSRPGESRVLGFIPTGWYPSALAISPDGRTLYVGTGKGLASRANFPALGPNSVSHAGGPRYDPIGRVLSGAVSVVPVPDAALLATETRQVRANVPRPAERTAQGALPVGKIKHVLYIIRENRTYDQVFGDLPAGNGNPSLTLFGEAVTPNAHALAGRFVLLDNLFCNGEVSEDGHQWCDGAYATDFVEKAWPNSYAGRGEPDADDRLFCSPAGYLWDDCARHGRTFYTYGEYPWFKATPNAPPTVIGQSGLRKHGSLAWLLMALLKGRDPQRADLFVADLRRAEVTGRWPQLTVMALSEDHTEGLKAGAYTPVAHVAANDQALGRIVQAVTHSRFWKDTAIFVIEDDAQDGPDHVDAHRTVGLVLSPYVRHGAVDSTLYTTASFVRTIEMLLGLPPMTQYDRAATPLTNAFTQSPQRTAFTALPPRVNLEAKNPASGPGALASARLDLSAPDRADPTALNTILWHALKPGLPVPAPVHSAFLPR